MRKLDRLADIGQSVWYDYIRRAFLDSGGLERLVEEGVRGVTSNPAIFDKAIAGSEDYDEDIARFATEGRPVGEIYEALVVADIRAAADQMRSVYDRSSGADGFVSLEVSPELADNTAGAVADAQRLFRAVDRPNLMIKVPATEAGVPAVRELIGQGISVNVTLLFGVDNYRNVAEAFISGVEILAESGPTIEGGQSVEGIASVAFREIFSAPRWAKLQELGARPQRLLWASTGTKNPLFSDTLYVDSLIGPDTVNTAPPATLDAFLDHGTVGLTITEGLDRAKKQLESLSGLGVDLLAITRRLQRDGVSSFAKAFESLTKSVSEKRDLVGLRHQQSIPHC